MAVKTSVGSVAAKFSVRQHSFAFALDHLAALGRGEPGSAPIPLPTHALQRWGPMIRRVACAYRSLLHLFHLWRSSAYPMPPRSLLATERFPFFWGSRMRQGEIESSHLRSRSRWLSAHFTRRRVEISNSYHLSINFTRQCSCQVTVCIFREPGCTADQATTLRTRPRYSQLNNDVSLPMADRMMQS